MAYSAEGRKACLRFISDAVRLVKSFVLASVPFMPKQQIKPPQKGLRCFFWRQRDKFVVGGSASRLGEQLFGFSIGKAGNLGRFNKGGHPVCPLDRMDNAGW